MLTTVFLSALLMLGCLGGAAASDLYRKSIHSDKTMLGGEDGRHTVRRQPHQQTKNEIRKSLDPESFHMRVTPTTSKISRPTIIKLYPPTAQPGHMHANMPMRFGRQIDPEEDKAPNYPNMPQRFGRSLGRTCTKCPPSYLAPNPELPQRFGRRSLYWSLLQTLATEQLHKTGLHWDEDFTSSSEVEMEENSMFKKLDPFGFEFFYCRFHPRQNATTQRSKKFDSGKREETSTWTLTILSV
ncbi:pro-FMRFamide-related neuropeptide VF [Limanda limanda]|uniref:pro-FMRFamide-related neuropeptide VF n=1 Tax=Limanda limanda TaxID=27771 RepID=UPI0029C65241|nr:pro-FMRFamide-related neuropeptide VF [Limanda limanda]